MICDAVDLIVQLGIRNEIRRVTDISMVAKELKCEDVIFEQVFRL
jgi:pilus assembly protein CpaF